MQSPVTGAAAFFGAAFLAVFFVEAFFAVFALFAAGLRPIAHSSTKGEQAFQFDVELPTPALWPSSWQPCGWTDFPAHRGTWPQMGRIDTLVFRFSSFAESA